MKEKILSFLKSKLTGVSESYLSGVAEFYSKTITEDSQLETTFPDGVIELLKHNAGLLQTEGDRRATEAQKTAVKNALEKLGLDETGKPKGTPPTPPTPPDPNIPKWFTEWTAKQEQETTALKSKLEGYDKEKTQSQLQGKITAKLKEKGIPESYLKGRNLLVETEDGIDQLVTTIEGDYTGFKQEMAEQGVFISVPPASVGSKAGEALGQAIADKRNTGSSEGIQGKKIV